MVGCYASTAANTYQAYCINELCSIYTNKYPVSCTDKLSGILYEINR